MSYPGYSSIFTRIRREAGLEALKLARRMEKTTYKLEAHHRHLHFTHKAIDNHWIPKSLRFKPPGNHPIFKHIMERASKHCMRARIAICHNQIRTLKGALEETKHQLLDLVTEDTSSTLLQFLKRRSQSVRNSIEARHENKFTNLSIEAVDDHPTTINKRNWAINLSQKPLSPALNVLSSRKARSLPQPHELSLSKILSLKLKPPSPAFPMTRRTPYEPTLPPCSTEPDFHRIATSPKPN